MKLVAAALGGAVLVLGIVVALQLRGGGHSKPIELEDVEVEVGAIASIHVAEPPATVRLRFAGNCPSGGDVDVARSSAFDSIAQHATGTTGDPVAHVVLDEGIWFYQLRCAGAHVTGRIQIVRDAATRKLPPATAPTAQLPLDGATHALIYTSVVPDLAVRGTGSGTLHFKGVDVDREYAATADGVVIAGKSLAEGSYTYWMGDAAVADRSMVSIARDTAVPQVRIERAERDARITALPGWSARVGGVALLGDPEHGWIAALPAAGSLAIELTHRELGTSYYVIRR